MDTEELEVRSPGHCNLLHPLHLLGTTVSGCFRDVWFLGRGPWGGDVWRDSLKRSFSANNESVCPTMPLFTCIAASCGGHVLCTQAMQ